MDIVLIMLTSVGIAYLGARLSNRGVCTTADLTIGLFVGIACAALARVLGHGELGNLAWPLFIACALTLGLQSLQPRASWRS